MAKKGNKGTKVSRPKPTKIASTQIAPHIKTLSNGKPRPKKRGK